MFNNVDKRQLKLRLREIKMDILRGTGFHAFRRFRVTWLRGKRCQQDILDCWLGHKPKTMSGVYSQVRNEIELRLTEAETVGYGFELPKAEMLQVAPSAPRFSHEKRSEKAA
jgi:integrase